ncbi:MAG: transporter substrate-binding domain-containing protein [Caldilineales bacterium]|nr:transporter substrate-binding domain-containing protein [Caldilineales bacterium]
MTNTSGWRKRVAASHFRWIAFVALLVGILLLAGLGWLFVQGRDATWDRLLRGEALRVAIDPSFPPFDSLNEDGQPVGFDVELAQELARRIGVPVEFKAIAFDGLVDAILADKADMVVSAFPLDARLTEDVRFSMPYFDGGLVLVTPQFSPQNAAALAGLKLAVEWGSGGDAWARANNLEILRQETASDALIAVAEGRADAAIVDAITAALQLPPGLRILTSPLESDPYVIVMPLGAAKLAAAVDKALSDMMLDGTWQRLAESYFPAPPPPPITEHGSKLTSQ